MRGARVATVLALAAVAAAAPAPAPAPAPRAAAAAAPPTPPPAKPGRNFSADFLFTLTARKATLERTAGDKNGTAGTLTLLDPSPHTIWFTDKPAHAAGTIDNTWFLSPAFAPDGGAGPWMGRPNAVLVAGGPRARLGQKTHPGDDDVALVVTLGNPHTKDNGDVSFNVTVIPPSTDLGAGGLAANYLAAGRPVDGLPPPKGLLTAIPAAKKTLESVSLFVDDYYMEVPAAGAPRPPPPPPPPPPSAFNATAWDQKYQDKLWARLSGPQPVDAYSCSFMGGCGGNGWGGGGMFGVPAWG